jgi:chromosome segregation ATPase
LDKKELATYTKLRETVDTRTFSEKTRVKALSRQLTASNETVNRYKAELEQEQKQRDTLLQSKSELEMKKIKLQEMLESARVALRNTQTQLREMDSERKRLKYKFFYLVNLILN